MLLVVVAHCQQPFCSDSSIRVRYIFGSEGASLLNYPDTIGKNVFTGSFSEGPNKGIALLKTDWGDSMILAKKIYVNGNTGISLVTSDGSIISSGYWGLPNNEDLLISRLDSSGNTDWIKRYRLNQNHLRFPAGIRKNILITNNAIYFNGTFLNTALVGYNIVAKLDLDGNILWSKGFRVNTLAGEGAGLVNAPVIHNNTVIFAANYRLQVGGILTNFLTVLTRLNEFDGSLIETSAIKLTDTLGFSNVQVNINSDNSLSLSGTFVKSSNTVGATNRVFNTLIDNNFTPIHSYIYINDIMNSSELYFDYNKQKQHAFLASDGGNFRDKYLTIFDKNDQISSTRKFLIPSTLSAINQSSVNLDDKENLHFLFHYPQSGKQVTEYARISNFAPNSTLGCFGKDTSLLTTLPLTLSKELFTWDFIDTDIIASIAVPYTEDTAIVTKELVCKIVSYCDSIHINGPDSACIGQAIRYSITKNNGCFKNMDWSIDTSFADIVTAEGDSAVTLRFKKSGYIHAAVSGCVVKDSFFVTVVPSPVIKLLNRDSLLCPGKTITLQASPGFNPYLWQDGTPSQSYSVTTPGFYRVSGTSYCGIHSADSITITYPDTTLQLPATQTICKYDTAYVLLPADVSNINWQPATNALLNNKTLRLYPTLNTSYTVTAERLANCPITETTEVLVKTCPQIVFIPNSFTPNGDGLNDRFRAMPVRPVQSFQLAVYNRYGQKLFETTDPVIGWDGTLKGRQQPAGGYTYYCRYRFAGTTERSEQGYFLLIR